MCGCVVTGANGALTHRFDSLQLWLLGQEPSFLFSLGFSSLQKGDDTFMETHAKCKENISKMLVTVIVVAALHLLVQIVTDRQLKFHVFRELCSYLGHFQTQNFKDGEMYSLVPEICIKTTNLFP